MTLKMPGLHMNNGPEIYSMQPGRVSKASCLALPVWEVVYFMNAYFSLDSFKIVPTGKRWHWQPIREYFIFSSFIVSFLEQSSCLQDFPAAIQQNFRCPAFSVDITIYKYNWKLSERIKYFHFLLKVYIWGLQTQHFCIRPDLSSWVYETVLNGYLIVLSWRKSWLFFPFIQTTKFDEIFICVESVFQITFAKNKRL